MEQIVGTGEGFCLKQITERAVQARLPGEVIHDIQKSAEWNGRSKEALIKSGSEIFAKWLNKTGVSSEFRHEIMFITATLSIGTQHVLILRKMDELIAKTNPPAAQPAVKPAEEKKP